MKKFEAFVWHKLADNIHRIIRLILFSEISRKLADDAHRQMYCK